jgi:glucosamine-6-phosphate deaminase
MTAIRSFRVGDLEVQVFQQQAALAETAASLALQALQEALAARGSAAAILASANSQIQFVESLVRHKGLDWSKVTLFHMDEYLGLSDRHPASFRRFMRERIQARLAPGWFHYIAGDAEQPLDECDRYARLLAAQPVDLCCLGIGENGHIAFNDPPVADFSDPRPIKLVRLDEACRRQQVGEGHYASLAEVPQYAFTLTVPTLCSARRMICIVPERRKARAVRDALCGPISPACPASFLRRQAHCILLLDAESASELPGGFGS